MWKYIALGVVALAVVVFGFSLIDNTSSSGTVNASAILTDVNVDTSGFARAITPFDWQFPRDFGPHNNFQTEWWYYTGNLAGADGRRFGYQFTIFRRAITPDETDTASEWRTNQLYLAHFTVTDVAANQFYHDEIFSRGGAGLAGSTADPRYRVWLQGWGVEAQDEAAKTVTLRAASDQVAVDFTLDQVKPPVLEGDNGLSAKSPEAGNASYYYSLPLLQTGGTITVGGQPYQVQGTTWMDHEFSTSALDASAIGWDWFGLQLDDQRELMLGYIRLKDGGRRSYGASLIQPDGSKQELTMDQFSIESTGTWKSPHTGATYPSGWTMRIDPGDGKSFTITLTPLVKDQELPASITSYWEGAVRIGGDVTGYGYAELTGYVQPMGERF